MSQVTVYLSLGANLGDRRATVRCAVERLAGHPAIVLEPAHDVAPLYESAPVDCMADQPVFLNTVVRLRTTLSPRALLQVTQEIEHALGRTRQERNGPRTIDIDILVYDTLVHHEAELSLPHPRLLDRRFVLAPLAALAPELRLPQTGETVADAADRAATSLSGQQLRCVADFGWAATEL